MISSTVQTRIDKGTKEAAVRALESMGLSISDAIGMFLAHVAEEPSAPFILRVPNATTLETFAKTDAGEELHCCETQEEMFEQLGIR